MKMLSTLLEATRGTIEVLGIDVARHSREVRARRVNAIGQRPLFDPMLEWAALLGTTALAIFVGLGLRPSCAGDTRPRDARAVLARSR